MGLGNEIKLRILVFVMSKITYVLAYLGLLTVKYGICRYYDYQGVPHTKFMHSRKRSEAARSYDNFRSDDIILFTYPKAGTHFTGAIIQSILAEKGHKATHCNLEANIPSMMWGQESHRVKGDGPLADLEGAQSPRIIMTHSSWNFLPPQVKKGKVKLVHCTRNPKDVMCSMFPFFSKAGSLLPGTTWREFVYWFMEGNVLYGSYFKYLKEWYPNRNNSNVLNLQFEDMKKDLESNVRRIAEFLEIELTQEQINRIVVANTFENKKKEMGSSHPIYRKGKSGGWKSELTVEQNEMMDEWIQTEMEGMKGLEMMYS